ncbi:MAG: hypothetical protein IIU27_05440, partial [Clostridiales bacterium]|nr:hypothetical protein [Clostridiales bacterium]
MQINPIVLTSWLSDKAVFQQGIEITIRGKAAPSATITFEVKKDPTDGRKVSKLDTDYGVILSLETTTNSRGDFSFKMPAYKASSDTYTFTFKCLTDQIVLSDIRCGDVWVFLGSDFLSVPMKDANATKTPLKRRVMNYLRFFTPSRSGLEKDETIYSEEPKDHLKDAHWIKVTDTTELADVSSSAFSFAYTLSDQISYPVGVVDLSYADSTIINWISPSAMDSVEALKYDCMLMGLYLDDEGYKKLLEIDRRREKATDLEKELKDVNAMGDIDIGLADEVKRLKGEDPDDVAKPELDFPTSSSSTLNSSKGHKENITYSSAQQLDFDMLKDKGGSYQKKSREEDEKNYISPKFRMSTLYRTKLYPLRGLGVRGFCFSPNAGELRFGRYDLMLMGLMTTLAEVFEPKNVYDDEQMPSALFVAMHPNDVDFSDPYGVLEFNENIVAFTKMLQM